MSKLWSIKKTTNLIFKDSKFVFNLFNTDLLKHEAHNLYKNGRLDAKVFKEINETEYLKISILQLT